MSERKAYQITANIEPTLGMALIHYTEAEGISLSAYIRRLVVIDLREKGLLPEDLLIKLTV